MPFAFECRTQDNKADIKPIEGKITGYPVVFNKRTKIADYFYEEIDPRAFDNADLSDVKFFINHNDNDIPVARFYKDKDSTMNLTIDEQGIKAEAILDVENNYQARMLCSAIQRGDIQGMSFCFSIDVSEDGEEWLYPKNTGLDLPLRMIRSIHKLYEISAVNDPAYQQTTINARSIKQLSNIKNKKFNLDKEKFKFVENQKFK